MRLLNFNGSRGSSGSGADNEGPIDVNEKERISKQRRAHDPGPGASELDHVLVQAATNIPSCEWTHCRGLHSTVVPTGVTPTVGYHSMTGGIEVSIPQ